MGETPVPANGRWDAPEETLANTYYGNEDYVRSGNQPNNDPMAAIANLEDDVRNTLMSMQRAGSAIEAAANSVNGIATSNEDSIRNITTKATDSLNEFQLAMTEIRSIVNDPVVRDSIKNLPHILNEAEMAIGATKETMQQFKQVGIAAEKAVGTAGETFQSLDRTIVNIEKFTEPLGERGDETCRTSAGHLCQPRQCIEPSQ
jgi:phospholipid/cholesterol/gamma-HCH transport system substrate-binding protein